MTPEEEAQLDSELAELRKQISTVREIVTGCRTRRSNTWSRLHSVLFGTVHASCLTAPFLSPAGARREGCDGDAG